MTAQKIADMTVDELKTLISEVVQEQLLVFPKKSMDEQNLQKLFKSIDQNRWTPPPGSPSTTELLRQDRDR